MKNEEWKLPCEFAIVHPIFGFYNGNAYSMEEWEKNFSKNPRDAFLYLEKGAERTLNHFFAFRDTGCKVIRVNLLSV